jgi:hypothetical protein
VRHEAASPPLLKIKIKGTFRRKNNGEKRQKS